MFRLSDTRWIEELARTVPLRLAPGSMMERLVRPYSTLEADNLDTVVDLVNADKNHEAIMDELSSVLAGTMMSRAAFIRNTVSASIEEVFDLVSKELDAVTAPVLNVQAVRLTPPSAFTSDVLEGICSNYSNRDIPTFNPTVEWGDLTTAGLLRGLHDAYGKETMEELATLIAACPVSLESIYQKLFCKRKIMNYPVFGVRTAPSYMTFGALESAIAVYLAHAIIDGVYDESIVGTPDAVKVAALKVAIPATQTTLRATADSLRDEQTQQFAKDIIPTPTKTLVLVAKCKYDNLLAQGGQELVTGLALMANAAGNKDAVRGYIREDRQYSVEATLQEKAIERYKTTLATAQAAATVNEVAKTRGTLIRVVVEAIHEKDITLPEGMEVDAALAAARAEINKVVITKRERLYESVRDLICRAIYPDTGALEFLTLIDELGAKDVGETPSEVATLAAVQLYARWGNNQLG